MTKALVAGPMFALGAAFVAAPLMADQPLIVEGQPAYQERVSTSDLDLRKWSEQQKLRSRVHNAANRVCAQAEGSFPQPPLGFGREESRYSCADLTYEDAKPQISAAIQRAKSGEQLAVTLVITAPVRAR